MSIPYHTKASLKSAYVVILTTQYCCVTYDFVCHRNVTDATTPRIHDDDSTIDSRCSILADRYQAAAEVVHRGNLALLSDSPAADSNNNCNGGANGHGSLGNSPRMAPDHSDSPPPVDLDDLDEDDDDDMEAPTSETESLPDFGRRRSTGC